VGGRKGGEGLTRHQMGGVGLGRAGRTALPQYHRTPVINQTSYRLVLSNVDTLTPYSGRGAFQRAFPVGGDSV